MTEAFKLTRIPSLRSVTEFREHCDTLGIKLPCDDEILRGPASPLGQPATTVQIAGQTIGNRIAIQPMEGWDGTSTGGITDDMLRRWTCFGQSGAILIYGGEA